MACKFLHQLQQEPVDARWEGRPQRGTDKWSQPQLGHRLRDGKGLCWLGWGDTRRYLSHKHGLLSSLRCVPHKGCPCCPSCQVGPCRWGEMSSARCGLWLCFGEHDAGAGWVREGCCPQPGGCSNTSPLVPSLSMDCLGGNHQHIMTGWS